MSDRVSRRASGVFLALSAAAWFFADALLTPPDFGHTDIYYFKDAGLNFAEGLGLRTRFTYGNPSFEYHDYAHYPPLYPFVFGLYAKAAGISARSNQAFNSLLAILTGILGFLAMKKVIPTSIGAAFRVRTEAAAAIAAVCTGYFALSYDRPDGLAVALGIAALILAIRGTSAGSAVGAGALCALGLFTSPFAGLWTAAAVSIGLMPCGGERPPRDLRRLGVVAGAGVATVLACLGTLRAALPGWFGEFLGVATGSKTHNETGAGYFLALLHGDLRRWWGGFGYAGVESMLPLLKLGAVMGALLWTLMAEYRAGKATPIAARRALLLMAAPLCLITAPYQTNYALITAALLLAAWATLDTAAAPGGAPEGRRHAGVAVLVAFGANVALTAPFEVRNMLVRCSAGGSLQRAASYLESHRGSLEAPGRFTAVSPTTYILWRQAGLHPLISVFSGFRSERDRSRIAVLALAYPGSGSLTEPQPAGFLPPGEYRLMFRPALPQPATVLGHAISSSSQTWESAIYRRRE